MDNSCGSMIIFKHARRHPSSSSSFIILLTTFLALLALTGFVCTHKIQAEEECLSSNVLCYECDSRYDPNCADPFDFSANASLEPMKAQPKMADNDTIANSNRRANQLDLSAITIDTNSTIPQRQPKRLPAATVCHGCCVKITSKTPEGVTYVKRTCTTNLQINYFMVGLVCMKESGDRGKMCFCETDYCNNQMSIHSPVPKLYIYLALLYTTIQFLLFPPLTM